MIFAIGGAIVVGLSLGVFGSGGSILTVPVLVYLLHHEDKAAIAESLGIVGSIALLSALPYAKGRLVDWRAVLLFGVPGMAGTYAGAWLAAFVAGYVQLLVFAGVMLLAAGMMWRRPGAGGPGGEDGAGAHPKRAAIKIVPEGLGVGVLTGFVGVGGGFLIVPALVLLGGLSMRRAVGTSLVIIAMKSATGFWKYLGVLEDLGASVDWRTVGLFVVFGAAGSAGGKAINAKVDQASLRRGFAVFLVAMALFIVGREGWSLAAGQDTPGPDETTKGAR